MALQRFLIAAMCAMVLRTGEARQDRVAVAGSGRFLALVLAGLVYVVTRYRGYNNARYVLIVSPILILLAYRAMLSVCTNGAVRRVLLSGAAALVLLSNFRTLDVGSKLVFGTFNFGSHALLDMQSLIGGLKLDSIVYNLESLQFHYLWSDVMQDLRPAPHTVFFMGDTTYNFPSPVDEHSYALTLDPARALPLSILSGDGDVQRGELRKHVTGDGERFFYVAFANADNHQLPMLLERYPLIRTTSYRTERLQARRVYLLVFFDAMIAVLTWAWGFAAAAALLWPARTAGPLDGVPLDGVAEAILIGVVFPALLWFHPRFLRTSVARGAILALLAWKTFAAVAVVPDGWCVRFEPGRPYVSDATSPVPHSWDVRADWLSPQPTCSAVMRRRYMGIGEFPVWFFNLPAANGMYPVEGDRPPTARTAMTVTGFLDVAARRRPAVRIRRRHARDDDHLPRR